MSIRIILVAVALMPINSLWLMKASLWGAGYPTGNTDLSGLTYDRTNSAAGSDKYLAVSDKLLNSVIPLDININRATGAINSVTAALPGNLSDATGAAFPYLDTEGIAYSADMSSLYISNERTEAHRPLGVRQFNPTTLQLTNQIISVAGGGSEFDIFMTAGISPGAGLESCTARWNGDEIWTTTQQPLVGEGPTIRLQKLTHALTTAGQYAYDLTAAGSQFVTVAENNVHDLMAMPDGTLISLELVIGTDVAGANLNRLSLYEIDFTGASLLAGTVGELGGKTRVGKNLLYSEIYNGKSDPTYVEEFEGIALGPQLDSGGYSVLLIADSGGKSKHAMYAFAAVPEPSTIVLWSMMGLSFLGIGWYRRRKAA